MCLTCRGRNHGALSAQGEVTCCVVRFRRTHPIDGSSNGGVVGQFLDAVDLLQSQGLDHSSRAFRSPREALSQRHEECAHHFRRRHRGGWLRLGSTIPCLALSLLLDESCTSDSLLRCSYPTIPPSFRRSPQRFLMGPHHRRPTSLYRGTIRSFSPVPGTTVLEQDQFCSSYTLLYSPNTDEFLTPVDERKPPVQSAKPADTSEIHATHGRATCGRDDRPIVHHSADGEGPVAIRRV